MSLDLAEGLPGVKADPVQLQQLVLNLVTNAVKACAPKGGRVDIATSSRIIQPSDPPSCWP